MNNGTSTMPIPPFPKTISFNCEPFTKSLVQEMAPLWKDHFDEIALYQDLPLTPALNIYETSATYEALRIFTARQEKQLVGYQVFFVHLHPHFSLVKEAVQDLLFLSKEMRHGFVGYRFIKWCDEQLQAEKVHMIFQHVNKNHDYSSLLKRLGYVEHDVVYSRRFN